jgi:hypothetical protein
MFMSELLKSWGSHFWGIFRGIFASNSFVTRVLSNKYFCLSIFVYRASRDRKSPVVLNGVALALIFCSTK